MAPIVKIHARFRLHPRTDPCRWSPLPRDVAAGEPLKENGLSRPKAIHQRASAAGVQFARAEGILPAPGDPRHQGRGRGLAAREAGEARVIPRSTCATRSFRPVRVRAYLDGSLEDYSTRSRGRSRAGGPPKSSPMPRLSAILRTPDLHRRAARGVFAEERRCPVWRLPARGATRVTDRSPTQNSSTIQVRLATRRRADAGRRGRTEKGASGAHAIETDAAAPMSAGSPGKPSTTRGRRRGPRHHP